eukprot:m.320684 g.320684  ORF g.320684 m.320684 type:complete len:475 (+) comp20325_c0_seq4:65-1489(+)
MFFVSLPWYCPCSVPQSYPRMWRLCARRRSNRLAMVAAFCTALTNGNLGVASFRDDTSHDVSECVNSKWILFAGSCRPEPLSVFSLDSIGCFDETAVVANAAMTLIAKEDIFIGGELSSPTWIALNPQLPVFYTADSNSNASTSVMYSITQSPAGDLKYNATILESCHQVGYRPVSVTADGKGEFVATADYKGGTVTSVRLNHQGALDSRVADISRHVGQSTCTDPIPKARQLAPHPHSVVVGPDGRFVYSCDLGLDKVFQYRIDRATGKLNIVNVLDVEACSGPRRIAFQPTDKGGKYAYIVHEMGNMVAVHPHDPTTGKLSRAIQRLSTVPPGWGYCATTPFPINGTGKCNKAAEVRITASAKMLFVSNRGHNSIAAFRISDDGARLTLEGWPAAVVWPRGFNLTPDSTMLVAGSDDMPGYAAGTQTPVAPPGSIVAFAVNESAGHPALSYLAHAPALGACDVAVVARTDTP